MRRSLLCAAMAGAAYALTIGAGMCQTAPAPYATYPYVKEEKSSILSTLPPLDPVSPTASIDIGGTTLNTIESETDLDRDSGYITVEEVGREEGDWIVLRFSAFNLGANSTITIKSLDDAESQVVNQEFLEAGGGYTPMFKGSKVSVQLNKDVRDGEVYYIIDSILVGTPPSPENTFEGFPPTSEQMVEPVEAICGQDDREPALENRIGRIMPVGCTGWNIMNGIHVTAGHCMRGNRMLQFQTNVPPSGPNGATEPPGTEDQFVIVQASIKGKDLGIGEDFAVFRTLPNSRGETAHERFGEIKLEELIPDGSGLTVTGFGLDDDPAGDPPLFRNSSSQTEQTHVGPLVEVNSVSHIIKHKVDTRGGNSGAPILLADDEPLTAVGIHSHGGCEDLASGNHGTSISHPEFKDLVSQ
jgi:Trypsin